MNNDPLRILVVDDDHRMARTLVDILKLSGFAAEAAYSGQEALEKVKVNPYHIVLTDVKMPLMNGVELNHAIRALDPDLPVVLMTAYANDDLITTGLEEGAIAALTKPLNLDMLLSFFSSIRKERSVVIVDDDPDFCQSLGAILQERGYLVTYACDPRLWNEVPVQDPQIVLLDLKLGNTDGLDLLKKIGQHSPSRPIILVTAFREEMAAAIAAARQYNIQTCLYKPLQIDELLRVLTNYYHNEMREFLKKHAYR